MARYRGSEVRRGLRGAGRWFMLATVGGALILVVSGMLAAAEIRGAARVTATVGDVRLEATLALTALQKWWGLRGRDGLRDGTGMLFAYDPPSPRTFVRGGVTFPLEVVFIAANGTVTSVRPLDDEHETARSESAVAYALEVPRGWCARNGVAPGDAFYIAWRDPTPSAWRARIATPAVEATVPPVP